MVNCPKCGTENKEGAKYCTKCGAALKNSHSRVDEWGDEFGKQMERWGEQFGKRMEDECFRYPSSSVVPGLVIGILIVLAGILWIIGFQFIWPVLIIAFGILIIAGAVYGLSRR